MNSKTFVTFFCNLTEKFSAANPSSLQNAARNALREWQTLSVSAEVLLGEIFGMKHIHNLKYLETECFALIKEKTKKFVFLKNFKKFKKVCLLQFYDAGQSGTSSRRFGSQFKPH